MDLTLVVELTNACGSNCPHCLRDKQEERRHLPAGIARKVIAEAGAIGLRWVSFTGGEVALYPELRGVISAVVDSDLSFTMATSGHLFDENLLPVLRSRPARERLGMVRLSIDGSQASSHDVLRGAGSFREVVEAATLCHQTRTPFAVKTLISRVNRDELAETALLAAALGASEQTFIVPFPTPYLVESGVILPPDEIARVADWIVASLARSVRTPVRVGGYHLSRGAVARGLFDCYAFTELNVDYSGRLTFCPSLSHFVNRGGPPQSSMDVVADLREVSLAEGVTRHFRMLGDFVAARMSQAGGLKGLDLDPCYWCLKRFEKISWLRNYPESPWSACQASGTRASH